MRSNYLWNESARLYEKSLRLFETLSQELNYNVMFSQRGVMNLAHTLQEVRDTERRINANHLNGIDAEFLTPEQVKEIVPIINLKSRYPVADSPASAMANIKAGRFRPLAITSAKRSPQLPDVPTVAELGFAAAESDFVTGLLAPAGTSKAIVSRLQAETLKVARSAEFRDFLAQQSYEPLALSGDEFATRVRTELGKWNQVVRERNIKVE